MIVPHLISIQVSRLYRAPTTHGPKFVMIFLMRLARTFTALGRDVYALAPRQTALLRLARQHGLSPLKLKQITRILSRASGKNTIWSIPPVTSCFQPPLGIPPLTSRTLKQTLKRQAKSQAKARQNPATLLKVHLRPWRHLLKTQPLVMKAVRAERVLATALHLIILLSARLMSLLLRSRAKLLAAVRRNIILSLYMARMVWVKPIYFTP